MNKQRLILEKRILHVPQRIAQELSEAELSENGYLIFYTPKEIEYYAIDRIKIGNKINLGNQQDPKASNLEQKAFIFLANNPDTTLVHYHNINKPSDYSESFGYAINLYIITQGSLDLFAQVTDKKLEFFQLINTYGYQAYPFPFKKIENYELLKFEKRVTEITLELAKLQGLNLSRKV